MWEGEELHVKQTYAAEDGLPRDGPWCGRLPSLPIHRMAGLVVGRECDCKCELGRCGVEQTGSDHLLNGTDRGTGHADRRNGLERHLLPENLDQSFV